MFLKVCVTKVSLNYEKSLTLYFEEKLEDAELKLTQPPFASIHSALLFMMYSVMK